MVDKVPKAKKRKDPEPVVEARKRSRQRRSDEWNMQISSFVETRREERDRI